MKKLTVIALSAAVFLFGFTGCTGGSLTSSSQVSSTSPSNSSSGGNAASSDTKQKTVYLYQNKLEIDSTLKQAAKDYHKLHPDVTVQVETMSDNYATTLKTKFSGGQAPDIFVVAGNRDMMLWLDHLADLSGQPWVNDMIDFTKPPITNNGKIYGMPLGIEGYGYQYRTDLFQKAGITSVPLTLTAFKQDLQTLKAHSIKPATEAYMDWYLAGNFLFNVGIARQPDPEAFIKGLNDGTATIVGNQVFKALVNLIKAELPYDDSPMSTSFNSQVSKFGSGQIAITIGGNWNQPSLDAVQANMPASLMPIPINDDAVANDKLFVAVINYWGGNKDSASKQEAEDFLNWLATSSEGQSYLSTKFKAIPAFKSIKSDESLGALDASLAEYIKKGKVYSLLNSEFPDGGAQAFGTSIQKFAAGKLTSDGLLQELQKDWEYLNK